MTTKVKSNRTKEITTTVGAATVRLEADESSARVVRGEIRWHRDVRVAVVELAADGNTRDSLRDLAKAILEAVDASEWHEETVAVEPPAPKQDAPAAALAKNLADLGFPPRGIGDRNKDQAAPVVHQVKTDFNGEPACTCGFNPATSPGVVTVHEAAEVVREHVSDNTPRPVGHARVLQESTKWYVCSCGWVPRFAVNRADSERRVANHVLNPDVDAPAGRPIADRPQA